MQHNPVNTQTRPQNKPQVADISETSCNDTSFNPTRGEEALWSAVITQALMDAGSNSRKPEAVQEKAKAIRWLLGDSEDFHIVCQNAGMDPNYVREKAKSAISRGCVWRKSITLDHVPPFYPTAFRKMEPARTARMPMAVGITSSFLSCQ